MNEILLVIQDAIKNFLTKNDYPLTLNDKITTNLLVSEKEHQFGDITTNAAFVIAQQTKTNPRALAEACIAHLKETLPENLIASFSIAGPGFINMTLHEQYFISFAQNTLDKGVKIKRTQAPINVEFVSANPTGPLHFGHGRGGIIGNTLTRILQDRGYQSTQEFYINDAGTQITKLGLSLQARYLQNLDPQGDHPLPEEGYQGEYLIGMAEELVKKHQDTLTLKDASFFASYAKEALLKKQQETLKNYGINFDVWFSEKTLHTSGAIEETLALLEKNGHTYNESGALWLRASAFGDEKDRVLRKTTGELTYVAADIAYLRNKKDRGFSKLIMVLGQDHHGYVSRMKAAMQALGYNPDDLSIILYQLVSIKESGEVVRMSKRKGKIVSLDDIISTVGPDVARYFFLNRKADAHLEFDVDLALKRTEDNPVFYIQYAFVRTKSIEEKATKEGFTFDLTFSALDSYERSIIKKIAHLDLLLEDICTNYQTHLIAYYAYELAQITHHYYAHYRILERDQQDQSAQRFTMIKLLQKTLGRCLDLLGLSKPSSM